MCINHTAHKLPGVCNFQNTFLMIWVTQMSLIVAKQI